MKYNLFILLSLYCTELTNWSSLITEHDISHFSSGQIADSERERGRCPHTSIYWVDTFEMDLNFDLSWSWVETLSIYIINENQCFWLVCSGLDSKCQFQLVPKFVGWWLLPSMILDFSQCWLGLSTWSQWKLNLYFKSVKHLNFTFGRMNEIFYRLQSPQILFC